MKVAIIHFWLVSPRGGEKVLEALCDLFPEADIFTHVYLKERFHLSKISQHKVFETFIAKLPFSKRLYQYYLPLMPLALEELDLSGYDLIVSSESGPAKGVIPPPGVPHICYCHSPMRYVWDMYHEYRRDAGALKRFFMAPLMHYLRRWDQATATQVTQFVANSRFVAQRISTYYGRTSEIIHPPVSVSHFNVGGDVGGYYVWFGQLVKYKRPDLAIEAFNASGRKLIVIGDGEEGQKLRALANANIEFVGRADKDRLQELLASCRALIFPGVEDFGIIPVEVMACGRPVIAYRKGGAVDTVVDGKSGLFFDEQTVEGLNDAVGRFEAQIDTFNCAEIRQYAEKFDENIFKERFLDLVESVLGHLAERCD